jgi:uncharacterized protein YndB with AHSA1/START domain
MKWVLIVIAVLVALVVIVAAIGAAIPEKHTVTRSAHYRQNPGNIWQALTDYQNFPAWRKSVVRVEPFTSNNTLPAWREIQKQGSIPLQTVSEDPPHRLVVAIADPTLPWGGTWTTEITPDSGGCTVRITEDGQVHNIIFRFVSRFIMGYTATIDTYLRDLGSKFGEPITIQP